MHGIVAVNQGTHRGRERRALSASTASRTDPARRHRRADRYCSDPGGSARHRGPLARLDLLRPMPAPEYPVAT